jgi:hypothetical protein
MQSSNFAFEPPKPDNYLVQLLALRRLLGADCAQRAQDKIAALLAHDSAGS